MANSVIIVAGGSGTRYGAELPKQFLNLNGLPILMRTIQVFFSYDPSLEIIVVLPESQFGFWNDLCTRHAFTIVHKTVAGGTERFHSVKNGLSAVSNKGVIGIHDAVRPLVSKETLIKCFVIAAQQGSAIPVVSSVDSIRELSDNGQSRQVNRNAYKMVQTPQCFTKDVITTAFQQDYSIEFTDDASVAEKAGFPIYLVEGNRENIKITTPMDLAICERLLDIKK